MKRPFLAALTIAALLIGASSCGGSSKSTSGATTTSKRVLTDLRTIGQLRHAFNTASGEPRLIVLVSPT